MRIGKGRRRVILYLGLVIVLGTLTYAGWQMLYRIKKTGYESCLASMAGAVQRVDPAEIRKIAGPTSGWHLLDESATDRIFELAQPTDCSEADSARPMRDMWGNRIKLRIRLHSADHSFDIVVSSDGPDAVPATADDLTSPWQTNLNELR